MSQGIELTYTNGYKRTSALGSRGILKVQLLSVAVRERVFQSGIYSSCG